MIILLPFRGRVGCSSAELDGRCSLYRGYTFMGGKNHQPCRTHLLPATQLSRFLSLGLAQLELGNVALEDLLICELKGGQGNVDRIVSLMEQSRKALLSARSACNELRGSMSKQRYVDLPTLRTTDLPMLGERLRSQNMVDSGAWDWVSTVMLDSGFAGILDWFCSEIEEIERKTGRLQDAISALSSSAERREVVSVIEENRPGNIKVAFADLYTTWSNFNARFLASSMLSTSLWYSFSEYPTLVQEPAAIPLGNG